MSKGISISQEGIPVDRAADYQKVLDSRWRFMEVEHEVELTITVPAVATANANQTQRIKLLDHGLDFVPVFHGDYKHNGSEFASYNSYGDIYCDEKSLYFERLIYTPAGNMSEVVTLRVKAKIYNLAAFTEYRALSDAVSGVGRAQSGIGVQALDGSESNVKVGDNSPKGYSIDTKKKILSVHKVTTKYINDWLYDTARITSVNTGADEFTFTVDPNMPADLATGLGWVKTGVPVTLSPQDFVTWPNPLGGSTYYIIKTSDTTFKLALSQALAEAGTAIDITSSGSLPIFVRRVGGVEDYRIPHETGYPPSYLFCEYVNRINEGPATRPLAHVSTTPLVRVDNNYLYFTGVQAVYAARLVLIILKDPVEIAS